MRKATSFTGDATTHRQGSRSNDTLSRRVARLTGSSSRIVSGLPGIGTSLQTRISFGAGNLDMAPLVVSFQHRPLGMWVGFTVLEESCASHVRRRTTPRRRCI